MNFEFSEFINIISLWILPIILIVILTMGLIKKVPIYEAFTSGAKDGFSVAINIIPYLVAIIVAVSMFKASGAINVISDLMGTLLEKLNVPVDVLPLMIVRPLSGSAALGVFSDIAHTSGPDSYATKLAAIMVGSSETTFYVLAVYFGSVKISKYRYALLSGLAADFIGIAAAVLVCQMFF